MFLLKMRLKFHEKVLTKINDYLKTGKYKTKNPLDQFQEYLKLAKKHNLEFQQIKAHAINFTKGLEGSAKLRNKLATIKNLKDLVTFYVT